MDPPHRILETQPNELSVESISCMKSSTIFYISPSFPIFYMKVSTITCIPPSFWSWTNIGLHRIKRHTSIFLLYSLLQFFNGTQQLIKPLIELLLQTILPCTHESKLIILLLLKTILSCIPLFNNGLQLLKLLLELHQIKILPYWYSFHEKKKQMALIPLVTWKLLDREENKRKRVKMRDFESEMDYFLLLKQLGQFDMANLHRMLLHLSSYHLLALNQPYIDLTIKATWLKTVYK